MELGPHVPRGRGCLARTLRWVRLPSSPLTNEWACGPTGRRQPGVLGMRVRLPPGPLERGGGAVEVEHLDGPKLFVIHDFLTPEECERLIQLSERLGYAEAPITTAAGFR